MGANLVGDGATFRVWAPNASRVHVIGDLGGAARWAVDDDNLMVQGGGGYWVGFLPGVRDGDQYLYFVVGPDGAGPKPVTEWPTPRSVGYNGTDLYSPELDYHVAAGDPAFPGYLARVNAALARRGCAPLTAGRLAPPAHQLKAMVDLCHLAGIAVLLDVVYNHGGDRVKEQDESLWRFDRAAGENAYFGGDTEFEPAFAFYKE